MQWRELGVFDAQEEFPGPLRWRVHGFAWAELASDQRALDGSLCVEIRSSPGSPDAGLDVWIHLRLERDSAALPWSAPLGPADVLAFVELALEWGWEPDEGVTVIKDGYWRLLERPEPTQAPRHNGRCWDAIESALQLGSAAWMQDWPLEVSDGKRLTEFCAFYDAADDDALRFDVMALILFSYEDRLYEGPAPEASAWIERTLRRDFALHGHTVAYWLCLNDQPSDPSEGPGGFSISPLLREIWAQSLRPFDVETKTERGAGE